MAACATVLVTLTAGCAHTRGPKVVQNSHLDYNKAVQRVRNEELLLNIVRRRYFEAPQFLSIASITTQVSNSASAGAEASSELNRRGADPAELYRIGANGWVGYSDASAISIVPRADEEITMKLTQRFSHNSAGHLANIGYPYDFVLALTTESIGNARGPHFGTSRGFRPGTRDYVELLELIGTLIDQNHLIAGTLVLNEPVSELAYDPDEVDLGDQLAAADLGMQFRSFDDGDSTTLTARNHYSFLWIDEGARESEDGRRVLELMNLDRDPLRGLWKVEGSQVVTGPDYTWQTDDPPREALPLWPRSFYSVLNFLAFSVQVPQEDIDRGRAFSTETYERAVRDGLAVDIAKYLTIAWSKKRPTNTFIAIRHQDKWFYIADGDADSKRFFNAVYDLFNLVIAPSTSGEAPSLTLPFFQ